MPSKFIFFILCLGIFLPGCDKDESKPGTLELLQVFAGTMEIAVDGTTDNVPVDRSFSVVFSSSLDMSSAASAIILLKNDRSNVNFDMTFAGDGKTVVIHPAGLLDPNTAYIIELSAQLKGARGETFPGRNIEFSTVGGTISVTSIKANGIEILNTQRPTGIPVEDLSFEINFSNSLQSSTVDADDFALGGFSNLPVTITLTNDDKTVTVVPTSKLSDLRQYQLQISDEMQGRNAESFSQLSKAFFTAQDPVPDFPVIPDEDLLTLVQERTFGYFWDFGHPTSGMARERNSSGDLVTSGGTGFGIMTIIVGIERNFITRSQGIQRMEKILTFLETSDRFHGAWSHWIDGNSGDVIPFSSNDNGGDLVETSYLVQGLLTFRQYLDPGIPSESDLIERINTLWQSVEWNWYTRAGQNVLYWHWSPDKDWIMNHQINGYNECLITYVLAAASPTHSIDALVYHEGWAGNGDMSNGKQFYGITLPLGIDYGGPLFFSHYSFLGLDPQNLIDTYANYWEQNVNHTLINHAYTTTNPKQFVGYSEVNWGLTASDNQQGYSAHSPTNDLGVITPTAAISSLPYTPEKSMDAIRFFYYTIGDRLWGTYGFYDAFNITASWTANSYLAIDQGPIVIMIENYRTGLLWDLFMSAPEVQSGLDKLGFTH
jgi:hypothetical protein